MVMDAIYTELTGGEKTFDESGTYAAGGTVHEKLLEKLEWDQLKLEVCEELFQRDYTLLEEEEE